MTRASGSSRAHSAACGTVSIKFMFHTRGSRVSRSLKYLQPRGPALVMPL